MSVSNNYIKWARRLAGRRAALSHILIQVNFWVLVNLLFVLIAYCFSKAAYGYIHFQAEIKILKISLIAVLLGALYGAIQGYSDYHIEKRLILKGILGRYLLFKFLISSAFSIFFLGIFSQVIAETRFLGTLAGNQFIIAFISSKYFLFIFGIYHSLMNMLLILINQVNNKYGPGVLLPLLLGRYTTPVIEERIFMFMDLKSSTMLAEELGHITYSKFIRDAFCDINYMLGTYAAEVYQYVGDEVVITWPAEMPDAEGYAVDFFFACQGRLTGRRLYYNAIYGAVPAFKAALHKGAVTAVEIGIVKREIAYHGDVLNTASRIQSLCNEFGKDLLASEDFVIQSFFRSDLTVKQLGSVTLKGKSLMTEIFSIEQCITGM